MMITNESTAQRSDDWEPPLDLAFQLIAEETVSSEIVERVKRRARFLNDANEDRQIADTVPGTRDSLGQRSIYRITFLTAAALLIVVIGVLFTNSSTQNQAYAQMVAKIAELKSFVCQIRQIDEAKLDELESLPQRELSYKAPSFYRSTQKTGEVQILDLATKQSVVLDDSRREAMRASVSQQEMESPVSFLEKLRSRFQTDHKSIQELGTKKIDGKDAVGFRSEFDGDVVEAWLDLQSNLPLEIRMRAPTKDAIRGIEHSAQWTIVSGFKYDVPVEDAQFVVAIPSGYRETQVLSSAVRELNSSFDRFTVMLQECAFHNDSVFPSSLERTDVFKIVSKYSLEWAEKRDAASSFEEQKKFAVDQVSAVTKFAGVVSDGLDFLAMLREPKVKEALDFSYFPGARLNDSDRPVAWFSPDGHETYKVLYADMSIRDMKKVALPSKPQLKN